MSESPPSTPPDNARLLRWLQAVITDPGGVAAGLASEAARREFAIANAAELAALVAPGPRQSPAERIGVYANAYFARLVGCLKELFPATAAALGDEVFAPFAADYLTRHPSQSYTLARLGDRFPEYLAQTRPPRESSAPDWADLLVDIARLELAIQEVFDGPGPEELPAARWEELSPLPFSTLARLQLTPNPSLRLVTFRFPLHDYFADLRAQRSAEPPPAATSTLALWRRNFLVRRLPLGTRSAALLGAILAGGRLEAVLGAQAVAPDELAEWFQTWAAAGFFVGWRKD